MYRDLCTSEYTVRLLLEGSWSQETLFYCYKELVRQRRRYLLFTSLYLDHLLPGADVINNVLSEKRRTSKNSWITIKTVESSINVPLLSLSL